MNVPKGVQEQGAAAVGTYMEGWKKYGEEKAYEAKILIVGEPGAGKTTLMKLLFNPKHKVPLPDSEQPSTLGVEVMQNRLFPNLDKKLPETKAHIWDFGGQDIQYMIHQFFLSNDAVYILLTDGRGGKTRYGYWFHIIQLLGPESPILVLLNRRKESETVIPFDKKTYLETFPNIKIIDFGDVDFGNLDHRWKNLENEISQRLSDLKVVGQKILKPWIPIREEIENLIEKHITLEQFNTICEKHNLYEQKEKDLLLQYFHTIGVAINFNDTELQNTVFLDPNWISHAIYDGLSDAVVDKQGRFGKDKLYAHWSNKVCKDSHKQTYSRTECNYLLNLMQKNQFEICYPVDKNKECFVVPIKLPDSRPEYEFDQQNNLRFRYQFPFMPEGLISRLIVRLNTYIFEETVWLSGVVLKKGNCMAEITQHETSQEGLKYIGIRVSGPDREKRNFLREIRNEMEQIFSNTFPYIKYSEMIVCNCNHCSNSEDASFFKYESLLAYLKKGLLILCEKSDTSLDPQKMIDEVFPKNHSTNEEKIDKILFHVESIDKKIPEHIKTELDKIQDTIIKANEEGALAIVDLLMDWIDLAKDQLSDEFKENYVNAKNSGNWKIKIKAAIPICYILGMDPSLYSGLDTEFQLEGELNKIISGIGSRIKDLFNKNS
ncbi:MAG: hypothetical protein IPO21_03975 [Bacteroidales bacterium]|nr:hypothetical protein [Bacteroidales bacterium]